MRVSKRYGLLLGNPGNGDSGYGWSLEVIVNILNILLLLSWYMLFTQLQVQLDLLVNREGQQKEGRMTETGGRR